MIKLITILQEIEIQGKVNPKQVIDLIFEIWMYEEANNMDYNLDKFLANKGWSEGSVQRWVETLKPINLSNLYYELIKFKH